MGVPKRQRSIKALAKLPLDYLAPQVDIKARFTTAVDLMVQLDTGLSLGKAG